MFVDYAVAIDKTWGTLSQSLARNRTLKVLKIFHWIS